MSGNLFYVTYMNMTYTRAFALILIIIPIIELSKKNMIFIVLNHYCTVRGFVLKQIKSLEHERKLLFIFRSKAGTRTSLVQGSTTSKVKYVDSKPYQRINHICYFSLKDGKAWISIETAP
mgnify:CR=1 FL=1